MNKIKNSKKTDVNVINANQLILEDIESNPILSHCLEELDNMPDSKNLARVLEIKQQVESGTYDFDANLDDVVDAMLNESKSQTNISLPLCEG